MLGMVPTFVWCVFGIFELNSFEYLLYYVHKFIMHSSLLIIAAEANAEVLTSIFAKYFEKIKGE